MRDSAGARPRSRKLRGRGRPRHNVGRASSPIRLPKTAWKLAKLRTSDFCGLASGHGPNNKEGLNAAGNCRGQPGLGRLVGEILFAGEESYERPSAQSGVVANRTA